jgi:hypothetical protein
LKLQLKAAADKGTAALDLLDASAVLDSVKAAELPQECIAGTSY